MEKDAKIFVTGHRGLAGSAFVRALQKAGYKNLLLRTHAELDLIDQRKTEAFFMAEKPDYVFLAAARGGGIFAAMSKPAQFLYENSCIQNNVIHSSHLAGVKKLLFLGSSCVYPKLCPQPIKEEYLMTAPIETTNDAFAVAKIEGIYTCNAYNKQYGTKFISVMPCNFYGPNDHFDPVYSHVFAALMTKFHQAKKSGSPSVQLWGSGTPRREFLHVDDLADACLFVMNHYTEYSKILNLGSGTDVTVRELALMMQSAIGFQGQIDWDAGKPDGTPQKLLDVSRLKALGWKPSISLEEGMRRVYAWYLENETQLRD